MHRERHGRCWLCAVARNVRLNDVRVRRTLTLRTKYMLNGTNDSATPTAIAGSPVLGLCADVCVFFWPPTFCISYLPAAWRSVRQSCVRVWRAYVKRYVRQHETTLRGRTNDKLGGIRRVSMCQRGVLCFLSSVRVCDCVQIICWHMLCFVNSAVMGLDRRRDK